MLYQDKPLEMYPLIFKGVPNKHSQKKRKTEQLVYSTTMTKQKNKLNN